MRGGHCSLRLIRRYDAAPAEVWEALTEPESLARWLGEPAGLNLSAGGAFGLELPGGGRVAARVRTLEPGRLLELEWRCDAEDASVVRFELTNEGDGTMLVLDHTGIEEPLGMPYIARWTRSLERFPVAVAR